MLRDPAEQVLASVGGHLGWRPVHLEPHRAASPRRPAVRKRSHAPKGLVGGGSAGHLGAVAGSRPSAGSSPDLSGLSATALLVDGLCRYTVEEAEGSNGVTADEYLAKMGIERFTRARGGSREKQVLVALAKIKNTLFDLPEDLLMEAMASSVAATSTSMGAKAPAATLEEVTAAPPPPPVELVLWSPPVPASSRVPLAAASVWARLPFAVRPSL